MGGEENGVKLYKVVGTNGECVAGGTGAWALPSGGGPGEWMPPVSGELVACANGYHLWPEDQAAAQRLDGNRRLFEAEYRGDFVDAGTKVVVREARLVKEVWRHPEGGITDESFIQLYGGAYVRDARELLAMSIACAERALPIYESAYPGEARFRACIEAAKGYLAGEVDEAACKQAESETTGLVAEIPFADDGPRYAALAARKVFAAPVEAVNHSRHAAWKDAQQRANQVLHEETQWQRDKARELVA